MAKYLKKGALIPEGTKGTLIRKINVDGVEHGMFRIKENEFFGVSPLSDWKFEKYEQNHTNHAKN